MFSYSNFLEHLFKCIYKIILLNRLDVVGKNLGNYV